MKMNTNWSGWLQRSLLKGEKGMIIIQSGCCGKTITKYLLIILLSATTFSCSIRQYQKPEYPIAKGQAFAIEDSSRLNIAEPVEAWWGAFNDRDLDSLINNALDHNLDIAVAIANVRLTRAMLREAGFNLFPIVTAEGGYTYQRQSTKSGFPILDRDIEIYNVGLNAIWEVDLFGRVSQAKRAAKATYQASFSDLNGAYVSVASEVALTYMQLRGAQYRLDVAHKNVANQQETYKLSKALTDEGSGSELDVARAEAQLQLTRSLIPPLQAQVKAAINRLSVLTGQPPQTLDSWLTSEKPLPSLPTTVAVGDPVGMLRRRPDISRAERQLASSVARYNVTAVDFFPKIDILGSIGFAAKSFSDLFTPEAMTASVGPSITWAAFDLGRVKARVDAADAETDAQLAVYQRTVLDALEEVSTSMSDFNREEERRQHLTQSAQSSARAVKLAHQRYDAGLDNFLDVLEAERRLLEAQDLLAISDIQVATNLINIYRALGGGWQIKNK